jgi:hypothetical protein
MPLLRSGPRWIPFAALLGAICGCSFPPERAAWRDSEEVIQPMDDEPTSATSLVVETVFLGNENGEERRRPFFLYDENGRYLTHYPNHAMSPVSLPAGRYVVVTSVRNTNKRVQVLLKQGRTTFVRLSDFNAAPQAP